MPCCPSPGGANPSPRCQGVAAVGPGSPTPPGLHPEQHRKAEPDGVGFPLAGGMPRTAERCILAGDVGDEIRMGIALPASDPSLRLIRQDRQLLLLDPGSAV